MKHYKMWIAVVVAAAILILGITGGYLYLLCQRTVSVTCRENDRTLVNPARGMYVQLYHTENPDWMDTLAEAGRPLAFLSMDLQNYTEEEIPGEELSHLEDLLRRARERGVMAFFRASYKQEEGQEEPELNLIHVHIRQLAELLNSYKDVVVMVQTGMVGLWGEWHSSIYLRDDEALRNEAALVVQWWLEELDASIVLNLRRPSYIRVMEELGLDASRLGFHNDGLLGSGNDLGTYEDREAELQWGRHNLNGRFNGGEMPFVNEFSEPDNAVEEFDDLAISYLNYYYNTEVLDDWRTGRYLGENAYDYIERHLGYRYYIRKLTMQEYIFRRQEGFSFELELANSGYSSILNRFHLYLVVDDGAKKTYTMLDNTGTEKTMERYQGKGALSAFGPVRIGFCYTDAEDPAQADPSHCVEFANDETVYEGGVNYIADYQRDGRLGNRLRADLWPSPEE